jgi:small subunit ribosomal protein S13
MSSNLTLGEHNNKNIKLKMPLMVEEEKGRKKKPVEKKKGEKKPQAPMQPAAGAPAEDKDFVHLVRIGGVVVEGRLTLPKAMMKIKGIGPRVAESLVKPLGYTINTKVGNLKEGQILEIEAKLENINTMLPIWMLNRRKDFITGLDFHKLGPELDMTQRDDINREKKIKTYRGIRHILGQPVRGQRTRSSFRTGGTLGVSRKKTAQSKAAGKPAEKGGK